MTITNPPKEIMPSRRAVLGGAFAAMLTPVFPAVAQNSPHRPTKKLFRELNLRRASSSYYNGFSARDFPRDKPLIFSVEDGAFFYDGSMVMDHIQSGRGPGLNNPADKNKNEGPAPDGNYKIGTPTSAPAKNDKGNDITAFVGSDRLRINPEFHTDRTALEIHNREGRSTGSHGCITTPDQKAQDALVAFIKEHHITRLEVVPAYIPAPAPALAPAGASVFAPAAKSGMPGV